MLRDENMELTEEEIRLKVLLKVSGRPFIAGALAAFFPPLATAASLAWWKVPCHRFAPPTPAMCR